MRPNHYSLLFVLMFTALVITGCYENESTQESVTQKNQEMIEAKIQYEKEWYEFKKNSESRIKDIQIKIDDLKSAMESTNPIFKERYANDVLTLEQKNIELKKELNDFKYDGDENWVKFKYKFFSDVESVEKTLNEIFENKEE